MRYIFVVACAGAIATAAGCGSERPSTPAPTEATEATRVPVSSRPRITPRPVVLRDQLFSVERRWPGIAIADRLAIDARGGARIVRGGGGGGLRIERCQFTASEMAGWRHDLRLLGPSRPAAV